MNEKFFTFLACWLLCHLCLWGMWRFELRGWAFFRLALEIVGERSWLRWPFGLGASWCVNWLVFTTAFPGM